jgi:mannose-1-phosphate guanylyltransferase
MPEMKAFLLAAGLGTRMGEVTKRTPKCLLPIAGVPLLGRWFDHLARCGVDEVLVNTHHLAEQVRAFVAESNPPLGVQLAHEEELQGSAGTLAANRGFVAGEEQFLVAYADNASRVDLRALVRAHRPGDAATLGLFRVANPRAAGIVDVDGEGRVLDFSEKPEHPRGDLAWAGLLLGTEKLLDAIPDRVPCDLGHDVLPLLLGSMGAVEIEGYHRDVGTPETYQRACADFEQFERLEASS